MSVAAKNGAILAGEKGPVVRLRRESDHGKGSALDSFGLPCGNFGCPTATGSDPFRVGPAGRAVIIFEVAAEVKRRPKLVR
jgi:hypothetical protein